MSVSGHMIKKERYISMCALALKNKRRAPSRVSHKLKEMEIWRAMRVDLEMIMLSAITRHRKTLHNVTYMWNFKVLNIPRQREEQWLQESVMGEIWMCCAKRTQSQFCRIKSRKLQHCGSVLVYWICWQWESLKRKKR